MSTITTEQQQAIATLLASMTLPKGLGTKENACSIAAINLALRGELTDQIPVCMSEVIGKWIIGVQDAMPAEMRNNIEWKRLLPLAAGTGRRHEKERIEIIMDWMWTVVLPTLQPLADHHGFGGEWLVMLREKTYSAANAAATASSYIPTTIANASTTTAATYAAKAVSYDSYVSYVSYASYAIYASYAAAEAAEATSPKTWHQFNPCGLLERLIAVS